MRNAGRIKLGYYPLPVEEAKNIRALLVPSAPYAAVDPCMGDGGALVAITKDTRAYLAGIELDADRAAAAAERGIATVHGSAFECRIVAETCSLLYLNPPYDSEFGPHSNKRMELVFLEHCYRWVTGEGVLVFGFRHLRWEHAHVCLPLSLIGSVSFDSSTQNLPDSTKSWSLVGGRKPICGASPRERRSCCGLPISGSCCRFLTKK